MRENVIHVGRGKLSSEEVLNEADYVGERIWAKCCFFSSFFFFGFFSFLIMYDRKWRMVFPLRARKSPEIPPSTYWNSDRAD